MSNLIRVQFEMSEAMGLKLSRLMDVFNIRKKKDLFNNAMSLLEWAARELEAGRRIGSIDVENESYKELQMPIFSEVRVKETAH